MGRYQEFLAFCFKVLAIYTDSRPENLWQVSSPEKQSDNDNQKLNFSCWFTYSVLWVWKPVFTWWLFTQFLWEGTACHMSPEGPVCERDSLFSKLSLGKWGLVVLRELLEMWFKKMAKDHVHLLILYSLSVSFCSYSQF